MSEPRMTHEAAIDLAPAYVLGALDHDEEAAVRDHLATCRLPHDEFADLGSVLPALLELAPDDLVEPPPSLRDRVMAAAAADLEERGIPPAAERTTAERTTAERTIPFPSAEERTARGERRAAAHPGRLDWAIRIAAVIAIAALGAWSVNLQGQLDRAHAFEGAVAAVVRAAGQPGAKTVILAAQQGQTANGIGAVAADGSVVMAMHDLAPTSGTEVYTAWVILPDTAPVSVGDFAVDASGTRAFTTKPTSTPAGATIAVTREPNPGNTAPQGPIVSAGVAAAPPGATG